MGSKSAFTYIEMLMILLITTSMTLLSSFTLREIIIEQNLNSAVKTFVNSYKLAQITAISQNEIVIIELSSNCYFMKRQDINCPQGLEIKNNYHNKITINQFGNIKRAGTVQFKLKGKKKTIVFSLGKGGVDVRK